MDEYEEAVLFTLALLESRLDRLEYCLSGAKPGGDEKPETALERIHRIEKSLQELSAKAELLGNAQQLLKDHKDILKPEAKDENAGLDDEKKVAVIIERAPGFSTIASQLKALDDQQIPQTDGFVKLAKLQPRIAEAEARHLQQALEISLLRRKSGLLVQRVKEIHYAGASRLWAEWFKRLHVAQRTVYRAEAKLKENEE